MKPNFWDDACRALGRADPVMRRVIRAAGPTHLVSRGDPFVTLARSIVGQQISVKAAQAVWERLAAAAVEISPQRIGRMRAATLQRCGLSARKVEYVKDLAGHFRSGRVDPSRWHALPDDAIIDELVEVRGIGRWTAEMFLIFNLLRPDVLPLDDLGLLRAIAIHYDGADRGAPAPQGKAARERASAVGEAWRPWRTVATWYMWRSLDPLPVDY